MSFTYACVRQECPAGWWVLAVVLALGTLPRAHVAQGAEAAQASPMHSGLSGADTTRAVSTTKSATWQLVVDGASQNWNAPVLPLDSLDRAVRAAVRHVQRRGHYRARLDSAVVDSSAAANRATIYVRAGPQADVGQITFTGNQALPDRALRSLMNTRPGQPLRSARLEADLSAILRRYEEEGFPLAQARIDRLRLAPGDSARLALTIAIDEGAALHLSRVEVESDGRTRARFVARTTGLEPGAPLSGYDPAALRERLRKTGLFEQVGQPKMLLSENGEGAVVRVPLKEKPPGTFDLALGYLPPSGNQGGRLVGSGQLALCSPFGGGRTASLRLDRRPGAVSRFAVEAADPFLLGSPLRLSLSFEGLQEDSTYARQRYAVGAGYRIGGGLHVRATFSREVTRPGIAGSRLVQDAGGSRRQRVARAASLFGGLGVRLRRLDGPFQSPRRGFHVNAHVSYGRKGRSARRISAAGDTTRQESALAQQRFEGSARVFVPVFRQQVAVLGAEASALLGGRYDRSDLFFLGGAGSLRGYDEDRFRGHLVGRTFAEYRYLLGRRSFAYGFFDLGYARRPPLPGAEAQGGLHPGFGVGLQFDSRLGLVNASYALNEEDGPTGGRVHLGLAVGL